MKYYQILKQKGLFQIGDILKRIALERIRQICKEEKLSFETKWTDEFIALHNNCECVDAIVKAASNESFKIEYLKKPFKWSEDFSWFTKHFKAAMYGLGSGKNQPPLHNPKYDFPDKIITTGIQMFLGIYKMINP